jgi:hypothetical protein
MTAARAAQTGSLAILTRINPLKSKLAHHFVVTRHKEMVHAAEFSCLCRRVSDPTSLYLR